MKHRSLLLPLLCLLGTLLSTACADEETSLGANITGSDSRYNGQTATFYADLGRSLLDDSIMTTGYGSYNTYGIIGNYADPVFGKVSAELFTQIALPSNANDINFSAMTIDSVVLTLVNQRLYPDTDQTYTFHFEVMQLAEPLLSDTVYYSNDTLPVNPAGRFFDAPLSVGPTDTVVRLRLSNGINTVLQQTATADQFIQLTKGLRIRLTDAGDPGMLTINFSAVKTCLSVYYRYRTTDTVSSTYTFLLGTGTYRFSHFRHDYTVSNTHGDTAIDGTNLLYLEPLAGYSALLSFDTDVRNFAAAHPLATIHLAELLLPVAPAADNMRPSQLLAKKNSGSQPYIADLLDLYSLSAFDGQYDASRQCYRLRITRHLQSLLRNGSDPGILLLLNARQSDAARTILNGISATNPPRIEIVFSE